MIITRPVKQDRGFTLIELLVVVAIISILSSVVLASLNNARVKVRDTKRISEIKQIQNALLLYYDRYGKFPTSGQCGVTPNNSWSNSVECLASGRWLKDAGDATNLSAWLSTDPIDPINQNNWMRGAYYYFSDPSGTYGGPNQWYMIIYSLEKFPNPSIEGSDGVMAPNGINYFHYGDGTNGIITVGVGK